MLVACGDQDHKAEIDWSESAKSASRTTQNIGSRVAKLHWNWHCSSEIPLKFAVWGGRSTKSWAMMLSVHQKVAAKSERRIRVRPTALSACKIPRCGMVASEAKKFNGHIVSTICLANRSDQASELILDIEDLSAGLG